MDDAYGQELDAEVHVAWFPKSNIVLGAALFIPDDGAFRLPAASQAFVPTATAKLVDKNTTRENGYFLYFMPTFNF